MHQLVGVVAGKALPALQVYGKVVYFNDRATRGGAVLIDIKIYLSWWTEKTKAVGAGADALVHNGCITAAVVGIIFLRLGQGNSGRPPEVYRD